MAYALRWPTTVCRYDGSRTHPDAAVARSRSVPAMLRLFPVEVPTGVGFMMNTGPNPDKFEALAGRCPRFCFDPVNA